MRKDGKVLCWVRLRYRPYLMLCRRVGWYIDPIDLAILKKLKARNV